MSIMGPSVLTMGAMVTMTWGYTVTAQETGPVGGAVGGPYLDSFTVQDSCQFNLCGPEYSQEFLLGKWWREKWSHVGLGLQSVVRGQSDTCRQNTGGDKF